ncbi:MAG: tRNA lysidine(34) synthetase TilS [Betaproteobacteria bacterium]
MPESSSGNRNPLGAALARFFSSRLKPASRLCVALSGGRDSVVLLHALKQRISASNCSLAAIHVHHGLSAHADAWADFCADYCRSLGVPLNVVRVEVPRDSGEGLEGAARRMRHAAFAAVDADWMVLAHHRDDQAETVLLNLLRGAGVAGVAGMQAERPQPQGPVLVRPWLDRPRTEIEAYAAEHALRWIDDESNEDLHFRRNFLRCEALPRLEEKFPGARLSLARAAQHFAQGALLLDQLAKIDRAAVIAPSGRIGLDGFNSLAPEREANLLRFVWVDAGFRAPDTRWIDEALRQLACTTAVSETSLSTSDGVLRVYRGELHITGHFTAVAVVPVPWSGESELAWAGGRIRLLPVTGSGFSRTLINEGGMSFRSRQGGERLQPNPKRPRRSLRNLLQESAVPPWERERLPYLWSNDRLVWVGGLGVDSDFACVAGEEGFLPVWEP